MAEVESMQAGQDDVVVKRRVLKPVCSVHLIRELRGMPFCILMVLVSTGCGPISLARLARISGYSEKPVRNALYALFEFGFVIQTSVGWVLIDRDRQLDLEVLADGGTGEMKFENINPPNSDGNCQIGRNSLPPISINNKAFKDSINYDNTNSEGGKKSLPEKDFLDYPELGEALLAVGIRENERTRRLLGRITPRDVRKMAAQIRDDPYHDLNETGLMVTILEGIAEKKQRQGGYESWNS
jgi:hypothetical protein